MNIENLDLSVRTYNALKRAGISTVEEFEKLDEATSIGCKGVAEVYAKIAEYRNSEETKMNNIDVEIKEQPTVIETTGTVIDNKDLIRAKRLDTRIKENKTIAECALWNMCADLKEVRDDKLYILLKYHTFEEYATAEIGLTARQVYNYIKIAETYTEENVKPVSHLGSTKLTLLARLDEETRTEFLATHDVEDMSKRKLEEEIKKLKNEVKIKDDVCKQFETANHEMKENLEEARKAERDARKLIVDTRLEKSKLEDRVSELEYELEEERNKPVEVAVADDSKELRETREVLKKKDFEWGKERKELQEKELKLIMQIKQLEKKIEEGTTTEVKPDLDAAYGACSSMFIEAAECFVEWVKEYPEYKVRARTLAERLVRSLTTI